jgi:hypothetical protein
VEELVSISITDLRAAGARARPRAVPVADIVAAGLLVGALDFVACSLFWATRGVPPARIAQSLAELAIGADAAHAPGAGGIAVGLLVEAVMGIALVLGYLGAATAIPRMHARPLRNGMAYGALAFAIFDWIVVPLSAATPRTPALDWQLVLLAIYMVVLGIPTALLARRFAAERTHTT